MVNGLTREQCRTARTALEWSQQDLADRSGVGSTSVKKFELGATLRPMLVEALRRALEGGGIGFIEEGDEVGGRRVAFGVYVTGAPAGSGRGPPGPEEG